MNRKSFLAVLVGLPAALKVAVTGPKPTIEGHVGMSAYERKHTILAARSLGKTPGLPVDEVTSIKGVDNCTVNWKPGSDIYSVTLGDKSKPGIMVITRKISGTEFRNVPYLDLTK